VKNLRKLAGVSILLILVFMVIALLRYQNEEEMSMLPNQIELYFNEGWGMACLTGAHAPGEGLEEHGQIGKLFYDALAEGNCQEVSLPFKGNSSGEDIVVFRNTLAGDHAGQTLSFPSRGADVRVVLDDEVIYQYSFEGDAYTRGKLPESNENYVDIPNVFPKGDLWIELCSSYPDAAASLEEAKIETRDMVVIGLVGNNIVDIGCCLLITIMAIIMFVLAVIRRYTCQPDRGELFLGLTGLAAGIYCFIGTDTLSIFYNVHAAYEMQEYLLLMLPLLLTLYFERNLNEKYSRRFSLLAWGMSIHGAVQILLQMAGLWELEEMANISAAAVGVVCVVAIVSLIQSGSGGRRYLTVLPVMSVLVLLSGGIANVMMNTFFDSVYGNAAGQYSMTVFGIMMAVLHILQISREYRASAEEKVRAAQRQNAQLAQAKQDADMARQEAMAANEAKGKFLAHMSHEIRTPINAVLGMDEMILRESREQNIKEYAMDIYTAGQTLLSLINDILDFSKIESGKMEIVPVEYDISSLIHDLANMASQRAAEKKIQLIVEASQDIPSRLYGDDVRLRQILANLLTNAVKYTHEGTIWLRVQSRRKEDAAVLGFEVEDTGIGIKEEDLPKLSAEFERIEEDRNRNIEGSGLGMSITIQLLALLGSRLAVESTYGKGSKFSFELEQKVMDPQPIGDFSARVRQSAENYNYSTRFCAPEAKILVVDDNGVNRKVLRNLLKETQIQVTEAGSGAECLALVQEGRYDLIFLDHMMPEMDGVETLHRMRALSGYPCQNTPVVALTANAVSGAKEKYLSEGFDAFLSKPIVPEKLENLMRTMLPEELVQPPMAQEGSPGDLGQHQGGLPCQENDLEDIPGQLPEVDGLDWRYAWLHLPDKELLAYTVKEFYAQIGSAADKLEGAFEEIEQPGKLTQYRIQVHAMKSLAATVGILPLSGVAKILEYAARDGKMEVVMSVTGPFLEEWRSYRQKLRGVFGIETEEKKEVADYSVVQALVEMTRLAMEEMDIDQADGAMKQLRTFVYEEEMERNIQDLGEAVTNLDLEEADRLGDLIIRQIQNRK